MGWNIDLSAITPGPGGTVMLGEGGIDAAARRYRERVRKQQLEGMEAQMGLKGGEAHRGSDAVSDVTVTPEEGADYEGDAVEERVQLGEKQREVERESRKDKKKKKRGLKEAWRGFRGVG